MTLPEIYDAPWPEDAQAEKEAEQGMKQVLRCLGERGLAVGRIVRITADLVGAVLRTWCAEYMEMAEDDEGMPTDIEIERICEILSREQRHARLDMKTINLIIDAQSCNEIASLEARDAAASMLERIGEQPPYWDHTELGNWATARAQLGDYRAALRAAAYLQEQGDLDDLARAHFIRAGILAVQNQDAKAARELHRCLAVKRLSGDDSDLYDYVWLARLYADSAEPEKATQWLLEGLRRLQATIANPPEETPLGFCYRTDADMYLGPGIVKYAVEGSIDMVKILEGRFPFEAASLVEARKHILEVRVRLEQHREQVQHAS